MLYEDVLGGDKGEDSGGLDIREGLGGGRRSASRNRGSIGMKTSVSKVHMESGNKVVT